MGFWNEHLDIWSSSLSPLSMEQGKMFLFIGIVMVLVQGMWVLIGQEDGKGALDSVNLNDISIAVVQAEYSMLWYKYVLSYATDTGLFYE